MAKLAERSKSLVTSGVVAQEASTNTAPISQHGLSKLCCAIQHVHAPFECTGFAIAARWCGLSASTSSLQAAVLRRGPWALNLLRYSAPLQGVETPVGAPICSTGGAISVLQRNLHSICRQVETQSLRGREQLEGGVNSPAYNPTQVHGHECMGTSAWARIQKPLYCP